MKKKVLAKGKYLSLVTLDGYEMVERVNSTGVVVLIPATDNGEVVLVEQFRPPHQKRIIELPAGLVNDRGKSELESLQEAAHRELLEETGFEATKLTPIGDWPTTAGMSSELVTAFFATGLRRKTDGGGDEQEDITVHVVKISEIDEWLNAKTKQGLLVDPKIYAALYFVSRLRCKTQ